MNPDGSARLISYTSATTARRMSELLEPICLVTFFADECTEELAALGHRTYWDGYFASRAAPLGRVPAEVVHAAFYSFAEGRPRGTSRRARETIPPGASVAARLRGGAASLRRILGEELARLPRPGPRRRPDHQWPRRSAPAEGRVMYAGMRTRAGARATRSPGGCSQQRPRLPGSLVSGRVSASRTRGLPEDRRYFLDGVELPGRNGHHSS